MIYTSPHDFHRNVLPPSRAEPLDFLAAIDVACSVLARVPDWSAVESPRVVSVDGLRPVVSVDINGVMDIRRTAKLLAAVNGYSLPPVPPRFLPYSEAGEQDDD